MMHMGDDFSRRDGLASDEVTRRLDEVYSKPGNQPTAKHMAALRKIQRRAIPDEPECHSDERSIFNAMQSGNDGG